MSTLESIESQILALPKKEAEQLQDWLADYLEDEAELSEAFVASIERGQDHLKDNHVRVFHP